MDRTECLPMEMAVNLAGNPTLIMLDSSGAIQIPVDDTVALAAAQGIKIEEPHELTSEGIVLESDQLHVGLDGALVSDAGANILVQADCSQLTGNEIHPQYTGAVETEMVAGEQCFRFVNSEGEPFSEGVVGVDGTMLSQAYIPVVLDQETDMSGLAVTAQIVDAGGRRMIIMAPSSAVAGHGEQFHMIEATPEVAEISEVPSLPEVGEIPGIQTVASFDEAGVMSEISDHDPNQPQSKRIKLEGVDETAPMYVLTVSDNGEEVAEAQEEVISIRSPAPTPPPKTQAHKNTAGQIRVQHGMDVTQAWFTTKDDKMALHNKGHQWKQGQWTKEEVEVLEHNIAKYCVEHHIQDPTEVIFQFSKEERKDFYRTVAKGLHRPLFSVYRRVIRMYDQTNHIGKYSPEEIARLKELRVRHGSDWATIGAALGRSASSVKDRCRLMKDTCNTGKWLPEEERLLAQAVYDLSGCEPGDSVTKGLSWALVAERVCTRSEKQCRTKWLNYLNWKQTGGTEWTREDDILLINKLIMSRAADETQVDWNDLSENWPSARSPQWLRGKWWTLKRHVPDYQNMPLQGLLEFVKKISFPLKAHVKAPYMSHGITSATKLNVPVLSNMAFTIPVATGDVVTSTTGAVEECEVTSTHGLGMYQNYPSVITTQSNGTFLITQPQNNPAIALTGSNIATDHIIVHTLPFSQESVISSPDVLNDPNVAMQLNPQQVIISTDCSPNNITSMATNEAISSIPATLHLGVDHDYHPLRDHQIEATSVTEISGTHLDMEHHISGRGEIINAGVDLGSQITGSDMTGEVSHSDLSSHVTQSDLDQSISVTSSASQQFVQTSSNHFMQNMSSFSDPMLPSENLIGSSSDVEDHKTVCVADTVTE